MDAPPDVKPPLIDSPSFCMLPWTHLSVSPNGNVRPCCNSELDLGKWEEGGLERNWNSQAMKNLRRNMLEGRENPTCAACTLAEKTGAGSRRQWANRRFSHHFGDALETGRDGGLSRMRLAYLDIQFSNVCNFRCRICDSEQSSSWYQDARRISGMGWKELGTARTLRPLKKPADLWRQLEPLLPDAEIIRFQGGEPLIMKEHYQVLDALLSKSMSHVVLIYNTNFSITAHQGRDVMKLWDRFEKVYVSASFDGSGRRGEYMRKGQNWEQALANMKRLRETCPRVAFSIAPTLSVMNSLHLPDFHRELIEAGYISGFVRINNLIHPRFYRIQTLPPHLKRRVAESYLAHIAYLEPLPEGRQAAGLFRAAIEYMMEEDLSGELETFKTRTRELDALRGENFADVFPELAELVR